MIIVIRVYRQHEHNKCVKNEKNAISKAELLKIVLIVLNDSKAPEQTRYVTLALPFLRLPSSHLWVL